MNLFQRWKRTTIANQLVVIMSAVLALVAIFQYFLNKSGIVIANRAYISIDKMKFLNPLEPNKPVILHFELVNDGNSSAEVNSAGGWYFDTSLRQCDYSAKPTAGGTIVAPKSPRFKLVTIFQEGLSQSDIDAIHQRRKIFQVCIKGTYTTLNESYPLEHCSYYFPE